MAPNAMRIYLKKNIMDPMSSSASLIKHLNQTHKLDLTLANHNRTRATDEKDSQDETLQFQNLNI